MSLYSIAYLNALRTAELDLILPLLPRRGRLLELGAGTGQQAALLAARGFTVSAVDVRQAPNSDARMFAVTVYDGMHLPFPDASFDVVFSSNVLEHIRDGAGIQREIMRVLAPGGFAVHAMPTHAWRLWTSLAAFPAAGVHVWRALKATATASAPAGPAWYEAAKQCAAAVLQPRHGEHGIGLSELWSFRPAVWRDHFRQTGFRILEDRPVGLFYTGNGLLAGHLSLAVRRTLARRLGSACHVFKVAPLQAAMLPGNSCD